MALGCGCGVIWLASSHSPYIWLAWIRSWNCSVVTGASATMWASPASVHLMLAQAAAGRSSELLEQSQDLADQVHAWRILVELRANNRASFGRSSNRAGSTLLDNLLTVGFVLEPLASFLPLEPCDVLGFLQHAA